MNTKSPLLFYCLFVLLCFRCTFGGNKIRSNKEHELKNTSRTSCFSTTDFQMCILGIGRKISRSFCNRVRMENHNYLYCCDSTKYPFFKRAKNTNNKCSNIIKKLPIQGRERIFWNALKIRSLDAMQSRKRQNVYKTGRKLLQQQINIYEHNSNHTRRVENDASAVFWKYDMNSILLKILTMLVIMFTFFTIIAAMAWLVSLYVLKRITRKNVIRHAVNNNNKVFDVTKL